jgi:ferredoxin-NADP reductase
MSYDEHQAMWPQMIAALAAIDTALGIPDDGCNSTAQTLEKIRRLRAVEDKANSYIVDNARLAEQVENLRAALQWYADGLHFDKASPDAWDTVSGEPQNWWCDEAGTATVEDGSIAAMVLRGELTGAQVQALD